MNVSTYIISSTRKCSHVHVARHIKEQRWPLADSQIRARKAHRSRIIMKLKVNRCEIMLSFCSANRLLRGTFPTRGESTYVIPDHYRRPKRPFKTL